MWYIGFRRSILTVMAAFATCALGCILFLWNVSPVEASVQREEIQFPFLIPGTDLIAEYFVSYEGDFFEDGSGEFVMNCAALCLYNRADTHMDFASVQIETLDCTYCFEGTYIPPKAKVIILDKYRNSYSHSSIFSAKGTTVLSKKESVLDALHIQTVNIGQIEVTNQSKESLEELVLYYKRYDSQWGIYIGGLTYAISSGNLLAGEGAILFPTNYANGYSKVLYASAN